VKKSRRTATESESLGTREVAQATLRLRSELECERVIRLAHRKEMASATAYRGPGGEGSSIFVMILDEPRKMEGFLPELRAAAPHAPISLIREEILHAAPEDFLRGGIHEKKPFRADASQLGFIFCGGALGAGARLAVEAGAGYVSPVHEVFPWGTMAVNVLGSFGIAVLGALLFERFLEERERMFWVLGFLGSFTTFSSYALQTTESWSDSAVLGGLYGGGSMLFGLVAALLGIRVAGRVLR
jgi:CrcB protein